MPHMHIAEFMDRFGPSNEGTDEVTGTWMQELAEQLADPESRNTLGWLVRQFMESPQHRQLEPVVVDFDPDRIHDGHSRVLALWISGRDLVWYGSVV